MNIFILSEDPGEIAKWQVDKHCVKMILESAQMLSTVHRVLDGELVRKKWVLSDEREGLLYSVTHMNHPCTVWTRETSANYLWHVSLLRDMLTEYTYRYDKIHKCQSMLHTLSELPRNIVDGEMTRYAIAMPDTCLVDVDVVESYRKYYRECKSHIATWKKRSPPPWWRV